MCETSQDGEHNGVGRRLYRWHQGSMHAYNAYNKVHSHGTASEAQSNTRAVDLLSYIKLRVSNLS